MFYHFQTLLGGSNALHDSGMKENLENWKSVCFHCTCYRLGRNHYREQYAIMYDTALVNVTNHTVYNDPQDVFHREPIIAQLELLNCKLIFDL